MSALTALPATIERLRAVAGVVGRPRHVGDLSDAERRRAAAELFAIAQSLDLLAELLCEIGGEPPAPRLRVLPGGCADRD